MQNGSGNLILQDTLSGHDLLHTRLENPLAFVSLSHDGELLAIVDSGRLTLWSAGKAIDVPPPDSRKIQSVDFSPGGQTLLVSYGDGTNRTLTIADNRERPVWSPSFLPHGEWLKFRFTPDGNALVGSNKKTIQIRRCIDFAEVGQTINFSEEMDEPVFAFSPDPGSSLLAVFTGSQIQLVNWKTGLQTGRIDEADQPSSMFFRPGGRQLIGVFANNLKWWNLSENGQLTAATPMEKDSSFDSVGYSAAFYWAGSKRPGVRSSDYLLTFGGDNNKAVLRLRDPDTGAAKGSPVTLGSPFAGVVWFTPDGTRAVVPTVAGWLHVFRAEDGRLISEGNQFMDGAPSLTVGLLGNDGSRAVSLVTVGPRQRISVVDLVSQGNPEFKDNWKMLSNRLATRLGVDEAGRPH